MKDSLQRFIFENISVRGELVRLHRSYQTVLEQHNYPRVLQKLLGEMLGVAVLLSAVIKFRGKLTVQFQGKEQLKLLLAQCDHQSYLRGLAKWEGQILQSKLLKQLQKGLMVITIEPEVGSQRYQGIVSWRGKSLAESIESYFQDSEQLPTRLWLAVDNNQVTGLMLQAMPSEIQNNSDDWQKIIQRGASIPKAELLTSDNEKLVRDHFLDTSVRLFPATPVTFRCTCSVARSEQAIIIFGQEQARSILKNNNYVTVTCEFCHKTYEFDKNDITRIFSGSQNLPGSSLIH